MKKLLFAIALAVSAVFTTASAVNMFDYVPADSAAAVRIDVDALLKRPEVINALNTPEAKAKQLEFSAKTGCNIKDLQKAVIAVGDAGSGTLVLQLSKNIDLAKALKSLGDESGETRVANVVIYFKDPRTAICQLSANVIAFGAVDDLKALISGKRGVPAALKDLLPENGVFPPVFTAFYTGQIKGKASCEFAGKDQKDLLFTSVISFGKAKEAQQFVSMLPMYAGMFSSILFSSAPELGAKVVNALKYDVSAGKVSIRLLIDSELADGIGSMINEMGRKSAGAGKASQSK